MKEKSMIVRCLKELNYYTEKQGDIHVTLKKYNSPSSSFVGVMMTYTTDGLYFEADGYGKQFYDACYEAKLRILDKINDYLD